MINNIISLNYSVVRGQSAKALLLYNVLNRIHSTLEIVYSTNVNDGSILEVNYDVNGAVGTINSSLSLHYSISAEPQAPTIITRKNYGDWYNIWSIYYKRI